MATQQETALVQHVEFGIMSPDIVRKMSVCNVYQPMMYEKGLPRLNSVLDLRMGSTDRRFRCSTCKHSVGVCNGHFGHIELNQPMYSPVYLDIVLKTVRCVCFWCSRILSTVERGGNGNLTSKRLSAISTRNRSVTKCPHCGGHQPTWQRSGVTLRRDFSNAPREAFETKEELQFATAATSSLDVYRLVFTFPLLHVPLLFFTHPLDSPLKQYVSAFSATLPPRMHFISGFLRTLNPSGCSSRSCRFRP